MRPPAVTDGGPFHTAERLGPALGEGGVVPAPIVDSAAPEPGAAGGDRHRAGAAEVMAEAMEEVTEEVMEEVMVEVMVEAMEVVVVMMMMTVVVMLAAINLR